MRVLTYGDIMDGGQSVFTSVARLDGDHLEVAFNGVIRVENPHKELKNYLDELSSRTSSSGQNALSRTGFSWISMIEGCLASCQTAARGRSPWTSRDCPSATRTAST